RFGIRVQVGRAVVAQLAEIETAHDAESMQAVPGIVWQGRRCHLVAAVVDADRVPPFRLIALEILESEEAAGGAHGLVNRLPQSAAVERPGALGGQQPKRASQVLLHQSVAGLERLAVLAVNAPGVFGKSRELALDMPGGVGADEETVVRQLDGRSEQPRPG